MEIVNATAGGWHRRQRLGRRLGAPTPRRPSIQAAWTTLPRIPEGSRDNTQTRAEEVILEHRGSPDYISQNSRPE